MNTPRPLRSALLLALLSLFVLPGCARYVRQPVYQEDGYRVFLRAEKDGGEIVSKGFDHPLPIAPVRIVNILARIDQRAEKAEGEKSGQREAALHAEVIYQVADGIAQALDQASPDQEVVVMAQRRSRKLVLFSEEHLTTMVTYIRDGQLHIYFGKLDWTIPKQDEGDLPEPIVGRTSGSFRIVPGEAMTSSGPQSVVVNWRHDIFRKEAALRLSREGKIVRRTILMEELEEEPEAGASEPPIPADLSPAALRALADLEEARRRGEVTEGDYQARRQSIIDGRFP